MALETKILIRNALFNVKVAKNHKSAIRAIEAFCDDEDLAVVDERVRAYLADNEGLEDEKK